MTDSSGVPAGADLPDFLDRLLARHRPAAPARPGVVRVRPRLAGPFERVEAVRHGAAEPDDAGALWPTAPQPTAAERDLPSVTREVRLRTKREHTVVRAEHEPSPRPPGPARPAPPPASDAPLLRPAAAVSPEARPAPTAVRGRGAAGRTGADRPARPAAAATPRTGDEAAAAARFTPPRPRDSDTAAAREAARNGLGRRAAEPPEQVVQVQIGRLEVTAGGAQGGATARGRAPAERPAATVSLADYLARGRE